MVASKKMVSATRITISLPLTPFDELGDVVAKRGYLTVTSTIIPPIL